MANGNPAPPPESPRLRAAQDSPLPAGDPPTASTLPPSLYAAGAAAALLLLTLIGAVLQVPGGWGIEDFLGWPDTRRTAAAQQLLRLWTRSHRIEAVWLYLALDSVLLVPLYAGALLGLARKLARAVALDAPPPRAVAREQRTLALLVSPVLALVVTDLLENAVGLSRTGVAGGLMALFGTVLGLGLVAWSGALSDVLTRIGAAGVLAVPGIAAMVVGLNGMGGTRCAVPGGRADDWFTVLGCGAHQGKPWLALLALLVLAMAAMLWLAGAGLGSEAPPTRHAERARLRGALLDVLLRSRYVLLLLALLAAGLLALDVGPDLLYAMAASPYRNDGAGWGERLLRTAGTVLAFGLTALALWLLVFSTWLWTRAACQLRRPQGAPPDAKVAVPAPNIGRHWARALALVPPALLVLMCARAVRETALAQVVGANAPWSEPVLLLLVFGLVLLGLGALFLWRCHADREEHYLEAWSWPEWAARAGVLRPAHTVQAPQRKFQLLGLVPPQGLVPLLLLALLLCRTLDLMPPLAELWTLDRLPSLALPGLLFAAALWMCLGGWLTLLEVGCGAPWAGLLGLPAVLLLGALGWRAQDAVWPAPASGVGTPGDSLRMLLFTALLAGLLCLVQALALWLARRRVQPPAPEQPPGSTLPGLRTLGALGMALVLLLTMSLLTAADRVASARAPAPEDALPAEQRPTLDQALSQWLLGLCNPQASPPATAAAALAAGEELVPAEACRPTLAPDAQGALRVYLVAAEGEGQRGAAWTAFVLQQLAQRDPALLRRVFAVSGVSGAAVGAAALRGCTLDGRVDEDCVARFAHADLLSPLLSAGLFEETLALLLPTRWCRTPGCGFLSRTAWFEQALETAGPGLRQGLMDSRRLSAGTSGAHVPYLLLEAGWNESGERAIASDLRIDWRQFPGAHDQLGLSGHDLALSTVAHNAARLGPLQGAGALQAPRGRCQERGADEGPEPANGDAKPRTEAEAAASAAQAASAARRARAADAGIVHTCGLLIDGRQVDPGAAQATVDLLQALSHCLAAQPSAAQRALYPRCAALDPAQRAWLRARLLPQVLVIRDEATAPAPLQDQCPALERRPPSGAELMQQQSPTGCAAPKTAVPAPPPLPQRPVCPRPDTTAGPAWLKAPWLPSAVPEGTAALAQARQAQAVEALRAHLGGLAAASAEPPLRWLELSPSGTRHSTHWLLPALAAQRMGKQAQGCAGG